MIEPDYTINFDTKTDTWTCNGSKFNIMNVVFDTRTIITYIAKYHNNEYSLKIIPAADHTYHMMEYYQSNSEYPLRFTVRYSDGIMYAMDDNLDSLLRTIFFNIPEIYVWKPIFDVPIFCNT